MATRERIERYQDYRIKQLSDFINLIFTLSSILIGFVANKKIDNLAYSIKSLHYLIATIGLIIIVHIIRFLNFKYAEKREKHKLKKGDENKSKYRKRIKWFENITIFLVILSLITFVIAIIKLI